MTDMSAHERLSELVRECEHEGFVNQNGKALPYLGWYWRDISRRSTSISWYDGKLWLNEPRKWGYPNTTISNEPPDEDGFTPTDDYLPGDLAEMCADLCEVLEKATDQGGLLREDREEFQYILFDYGGHIPVGRYRCVVDDCGEEFKHRSDPLDEHGTTLYDHIENEHPDALGDGELPNNVQHWERFVYEYIDTDPDSDTRGQRLSPNEVDNDD